MDTPIAESSAPLSVNQAAALFSAPKEPEKHQSEAQAEEAAAVETETSPAATQAEATPETAEAAPEVQDETVTIEVDGKPVELKKSELADYYKNGLRQADYTRKTMETAEQRKAAEAEAGRAREERQKYAMGLQQAQSVLSAQLHEQSQIDWQKLLETDPVEYLKQQHLAQSRQAQLSRVTQEQQHLAARWQTEQAQQMHAYVQTQQQELLAKLPEWKDASKAQVERDAIRTYLKGQGLDEAQIGNITDHRVVVISRKAMLYDQMMSKAQAAAKKVAQLPQRTERPGSGEVSALDGRTAAMKRLGASGSVRDAAAVFASLRKS